MSLRRHHAAPALEVSVLVAAGVSKGRCAATTRPLPSVAHTSSSTAPVCCRRPPTVRRTPCCRRHRRARAAAATAAVHRSYGDESSTCQRSLLSGLSPRLLLQRHKVCTALRRLVLTYFTEHSACLFLLFFFIQYAHAFFSSFWPCLSSASSSKEQ